MGILFDFLIGSVLNDGGHPDATQDRRNGAVHRRPEHRRRRKRATNMERTCWLCSLLTATARNQPRRTRSARPRASFLSLLFIRIDKAAWACLASMQTTGRSTRFSSCHSQLDMAPVSKPIRSARGALEVISFVRAPGVDCALPSKVTRPSSLRTQTDVSFCETSRPTYCFTAPSDFCVEEANCSRGIAEYAPCNYVIVCKRLKADRHAVGKASQMQLVELRGEGAGPHQDAAAEALRDREGAPGPVLADFF